MTHAPLTISIDAMGGDFGPSVVIPGLDIARIRRPHVHYILHGDDAAIKAQLEQFPALKRLCTIVHAEVSIRMDDKPSVALRKGRKTSSMWKAIESVQKGEASATVSAGNTGALMAMSTFCLRPMPGISRPGIAAIWPTLRGESIVLDVGATVGLDTNLLIDFAVMGGAMARALFDLDRPTVGLLNIGVEEVKGLDAIKSAARILKDWNPPFLNYYGFVEGNDLGKGTVDVVVTDGFTGNIALKTAEGTAKQIYSYLKSAMTSTILAKIGAFFAQNAFRAMKVKLDPRKVNGGVFLGLNGIVIKSHGGTDAVGYATAVELAVEMVENGLLAKIQQNLAHYDEIRTQLLLDMAEPKGLSAIQGDAE